MSNRLRFEITEEEILNTPYITYLQILKDRGAPIDGSFVLKPIEGWKVTSYTEMNYTRVFIFTKISRSICWNIP